MSHIMVTFGRACQYGMAEDIYIIGTADNK